MADKTVEKTQDTKAQDSVTLSRTDLADLVSAAVTAAVNAQAALPPKPAPRAPGTEKYLIPSPTPVTERMTGRLLSGATGTLIITNGKTTNIEGYAFPVGIDKHDDMGGLVPRGIDIDEGNPVYLTWKWQTYWQADLTAYVGKKAPAALEHAAPVEG